LYRTISDYTHGGDIVTFTWRRADAGLFVTAVCGVGWILAPVHPRRWMKAVGVTAHRCIAGSCFLASARCSDTGNHPRAPSRSSVVVQGR